MNVTNHPLVGQRVRLTGVGWAPSVRGETYPITAIDEDGDAVLFAPLAGYSSDRPLVTFANIQDEGDDYAGELVHTIFGSRSRNVDPLPYVDGHLDAAGNGRRFAEPYHLDGNGTDCTQCATRHEPRAGYDTAPIHPVNPILVAFRGRVKYQHDVAKTTTARSLARVWNQDVARYSGDVGASPEHTAHARRVIERLARL